MEKQYSVSQLSKIIKKNLLIIFILMIFGALFAGLYAKKKQTTTYTAASNVMVGERLDNVDYKNSAVQAELSMMKSYEKVVESDKTMEIAHHSLNKSERKNIPIKNFDRGISANSHPDSLVLTISATSNKDTKSIKMVNAVADASVRQIEKYSPLSTKVHVISKASKKNVESKTHPSIKKYIILGAALGILVGMIISFSLTTWKHNN